MKTSVFPPWIGFLSLSLTLVLLFSWKMVTPCVPGFVHKLFVLTLNGFIHQGGFSIMTGQAVTSVSRIHISCFSRSCRVRTPSGEGRTLVVFLISCPVQPKHFSELELPDKIQYKYFLNIA